MTMLWRVCLSSLAGLGGWAIIDVMDITSRVGIMLIGVVVGIVSLECLKGGL